MSSELEIVLEQEKRLVFSNFDEDVAWRLGSLIRDRAEQQGKAVAIEIARGSDLLFFHAMTGTSPANADWARRKRNLVNLIGNSSYAIGLRNAQAEQSIQQLMGLPERDFAGHGGCFPIRVTGSGLVGTATVSGLPQRDDHILVVD